jgi:hypothetical protein
MHLVLNERTIIDDDNVIKVDTNIVGVRQTGLSELLRLSEPLPYHSSLLIIYIKVLELEIKRKHSGFNNINYEKAPVVWRRFG